MKRIIPAPNAEYSLEHMDGETLLYSATQTKTIYLNQTASMIWQLCDAERTIDDIIDILNEAFPATDTLRQDVDSCLEQLRVDGALSMRPAD